MDSTKRFSDRVENYVRYRPGYPEELIRYLGDSGLNRESVVCDLGAGTGILSGLLIDQVKELYAIYVAPLNQDQKSENLRWNYAATNESFWKDS